MNRGFRPGSTRRTALRGDQGTAGLETVALVPIIILVGSLTLQLGVAIWTTVAADGAARSAARAATLGRNPFDAARASLPGSLTIDPSNIQRLPGTDQVRIILTIDIPQVSILTGLKVKRDAVMPDIKP